MYIVAKNCSFNLVGVQIVAYFVKAYY